MKRLNFLSSLPQETPRKPFTAGDALCLVTQIVYLKGRRCNRMAFAETEYWENIAKTLSDYWQVFKMQLHKYCRAMFWRSVFCVNLLTHAKHVSVPVIRYLENCGTGMLIASKASEKSKGKQIHTLLSHTKVYLFLRNFKLVVYPASVYIPQALR